MGLLYRVKKARDPVQTVKDYLLEKAEASASEVKQLEQAVRAEIDLAVEQAKRDSPPPASELTRDIFAGQWVGPPPRMCNS